MALSFGLSRFHGHSSCLVCEVTLKFAILGWFEIPESLKVD